MNGEGQGGEGNTKDNLLTCLLTPQVKSAVLRFLELKPRDNPDENGERETENLPSAFDAAASGRNLSVV